jgi:hypothetical protein
MGFERALDAHHNGLGLGSCAVPVWPVPATDQSPGPVRQLMQIDQRTGLRGLRSVRDGVDDRSSTLTEQVGADEKAQGCGLFGDAPVVGIEPLAAV